MSKGQLAVTYWPSTGYSFKNEYGTSLISDLLVGEFQNMLTVAGKKLVEVLKTKVLQCIQDMSDFLSCKKYIYITCQ